MQRLPFVLRFKAGKKEAGLEALRAVWPQVKPVLDDMGVDNFSVWSIQDFLFCYGEYPDCVPAVPAEARAAWEKALGDYLEVFSYPCTLPMMYHDIGIVREDKSLIRHRVFATHLKPGCAPEYKRRHDALVVARGDAVKEGPESNFTIWYANGYIFGYCELVRAFDHEKTEEEKAADIAWETRGLEIMDWLTDDIDWITGEKHDRVQLVCQQ